MADFIEERQVAFWRMAPHDDLLAGEPTLIYWLAEPDREYIIYFVRGGTATLDIPAGDFEAVWYSPRNGAYRDEKGVRTGGSQSFTAPDDKDWVLHIVSSEIK